MYIEKKKPPKNGAMILDVLHISLGLMIVILGVLTFLNPENHMLFFPVIFFTAEEIGAFSGGTTDAIMEPSISFFFTL